MWWTPLSFGYWWSDGWTVPAGLYSKRPWISSKKRRGAGSRRALQASRVRRPTYREVATMGKYRAETAQAPARAPNGRRKQKTLWITNATAGFADRSGSAGYTNSLINNTPTAHKQTVLPSRGRPADPAQPDRPTRRLVERICAIHRGPDVE